MPRFTAMPKFTMMPRFETNVIRVGNYIYEVSLGQNGNENICRFLKKMK